MKCPIICYVEKKANFFEYHEEDWKSGGSAQADRDTAVLNIFDILGEQNQSTYYKVGAVMVTAMQYFYKRKENSYKLEQIENSGVGQAIKKGI